jgi:hypothetical protein
MIRKIQTFLSSLQKTILALIKVLFLSKWKTWIKSLPQEKKCVILGNGPSFSHLYANHKDFLKNKDIFCVNYFPTTAFFEEIKPEYFIICAPEFWMDNIDDIYRQGKEKIFAALNEKVNWEIILLIPFSSRTDNKWQEQIKNNLHISIRFFNETGIEGWHEIIFRLWKRGLGMPRPHNILIPAIFNAINLGYKEIYLWGADQNQFKELTVDENNIPLISHRHFYDFDSARPEHMRKLGKGQRKIHEILYKFMVAFASYHALNNYSIWRGSKILNMTKGSLIDAFERIDPDNLN